MNKTIKIMQVLQGKATRLKEELNIARPNTTHYMLINMELELLEQRMSAMHDELASQALEIFDMNTTTTYGEGLPF